MIVHVNYIVPQTVSPFEDSVMASVKIIYTLPDCHGWFHCVCQLLWRESACCWIHLCVTIALVTFIGILVFQLADVTGITQCFKKKYTDMKGYTMENRHSSWAEAEVKSESDTDFIWLTQMSMNNYHPLHRNTGVTTKHLIALCLHELSLYW